MGEDCEVRRSQGVNGRRRLVRWSRREGQREHWCKEEKVEREQWWAEGLELLWSTLIFCPVSRRGARIKGEEEGKATTACLQKW